MFRPVRSGKTSWPPLPSDPRPRMVDDTRTGASVYSTRSISVRTTRASPSITSTRSAPKRPVGQRRSRSSSRARRTGTRRFPRVFFDCVIQHQSCTVGAAGKTPHADGHHRRPTPLDTELHFDIQRVHDARGITAATARLTLNGEVPMRPGPPTPPPCPGTAGPPADSADGARPDRWPHPASVSPGRRHRGRACVTTSRPPAREGDILPSQESLFTEFGVSPPALREAIHILEVDGLVSVRQRQRGRRRGAPAVGRTHRAL